MIYANVKFSQYEYVRILYSHVILTKSRNWSLVIYEYKETNRITKYFNAININTIHALMPWKTKKDLNLYGSNDLGTFIMIYRICYERCVLKKKDKTKICVEEKKTQYIL